MASSHTSLEFKVHRREPELIKPAKPTPHESSIPHSRLREGPHASSWWSLREGILFIEADAELHRASSLMSGSSGGVKLPLLLVQCEMARSQSPRPAVWERQVLNASNPPRVTCTHREYEEPLFHFRNSNSMSLEMSHHCLQPDPTEDMRIICIVNAREKFNPPLPRGYYGIGFAFPVAVATAETLKKSIERLRNVRKGKADVTEEYMRSVSSLMVTKGEAHFTVFEEVDLDGVMLYMVELPKVGLGPSLELQAFISIYKQEGENGIVVPFCLPAPAMERFVKELGGMLKTRQLAATKSKFIVSSL
uniref:Uncharacterized protein n=1 Tax=Salix viminalis TaxID=40686 RepID=A0A6N2NHQ3_SALVM